MEIEQYLIKFEYIQGSKNTLADTMSRLIVINHDACHHLKPEGQEYGYSVLRIYPISL